ncbi:polysaccharide deacetylase family protein [Ilumatobacter sp.]|uniref:polysaccharide deacetylase family protein n=1 Tax=Ilumatobacter sp. TaxID=1967498 RepID=UPI003AF793FF
MATELTIVMYHYVRELDRTRYPMIKGLELAGFRRQLDYLQSNHTIVRMEDVIAAIRGHGDLPPGAALLTFDDGYAEHFDLVFPILHDRGLQGSFFPPVATVRHGELLDVNRVHFVLASCDSPTRLAAAIDSAVSSADRADVLSPSEYRNEWAHPNRFDDVETIYVKRMLQTALPPDFRASVARDLFDRFVSVDEAAFASELYLSEEQARLMVSCGMYFGSHGVSHHWLNRVDRDTQQAEIDGSIEFLGSIGMPVTDHWAMCYPFGGWDDSLIDILEAANCTVGVTTEVATAMIGEHDPLRLPRFDTNDLPQ